MKLAADVRQNMPNDRNTSHSTGMLISTLMLLHTKRSKSQPLQIISIGNSILQKNIVLLFRIIVSSFTSRDSEKSLQMESYLKQGGLDM